MTACSATRYSYSGTVLTMTSILRIPAGDRKYLLVAKRRLIFTSSSVAVSFCFSLADDDRWYNVPRRPLTGLNPVRVLPSLSLTVATPDDETFAEARILKNFLGKDTTVKSFCLPVLAVSMCLLFNL